MQDLGSYVGPPIGGGFNGQQVQQQPIGPPPGTQVPPGGFSPPGTPPFNPTMDPNYMRTHNDYPHPGERFMTTKELYRNYAIVATIFFLAGCFFMFKMFNRVVAIIDAAAGQIG